VLILDTDILTIIQFRQGALYERVVARLEAFSPDVAVTIISFEEQLRGWLALISKSQALPSQIVAYGHLAALLHDFRDRRVLGFDSSAADIFTDLRWAHRRKGVMDLKIAAIALANGATLATRNRRDFGDIDGLQVIDLTRADT
jgi:tRNA(fMet)-specific endonuclease VapC